MEIEYSTHFRRAYQKLPSGVQKRAEKREALFREHPFHLVLKTHKLHGKLKEFFSFSIDHRYRIVFKFVGRQRVVFLDAGDHDIYR